MRSVTLSLSLVLVVVSVAMAGESSAIEKVYFDLNDAPALFEKFINEHKKQYKDDADKEVHLRAFTANLEKINNLNKQSTSATFGINKFADYTEEERKNMFGFGRKKE